jgi:hypothetical protein
MTKYFTRQHNPKRHTTGTVRNLKPQLQFLVGHNLPEILIWPSWRQVQTSGTITRLCLKLWFNLVSCVSTTRGFSGVSMILNRKGRLLALEYWRCKGCIVVWRMLPQNFNSARKCSGTEQQEFHWDKVREKFAQAKSYGAPWREARNAALSEESTTASRASTAQLELCDVSDVGLSALLGSLPASYTCDRDLGMHKAPRIDNSDPYNIALTVNGRVFQNIIVDWDMKWLW